MLLLWSHYLSVIEGFSEGKRMRKDGLRSRGWQRGKVRRGRGGRSGYKKSSIPFLARKFSQDDMMRQEKKKRRLRTLLLPSGTSTTSTPSLTNSALSSFAFAPFGT